MNFVSKTIPYHLTEGVSVDQTIELFFFIDLNKGSLTTSRIILFNLTEEKSESITFDYKNKVLKIKAMNHLKPNTHYQVQLVGGNNGIKDIVGRSLEETYVTEFYTKETKGMKPPVLRKPTDLIEITNDISFEWNPAIDAQYYELEISRSNTFNNLVWPKVPTPIHALYVTPFIDYERGTYYARIRSVGHDNEASHYSKTVRYYYNGAKQNDHSNVKDNTDKEIDEEIIDIEDPIEEEEESNEDNLIIQTSGRVIHAPSEIDTLQDFFVGQNQENGTSSFSLVRSDPKHKALNKLNLEQTFTLYFNQKVDPNSVDEDSIYVLKERN